MTDHHSYLAKIVTWAATEDAIRALLITGSRARGDGSVDAYSDLDVEIITSEIRRYTADDSWLDRLGEVWIRFPLDPDAPYRLVWFAAGIKVDFQFVGLDRITSMLRRGELSDEYKRGYLVALDKDGLYEDMPPSPREFPAPRPPRPEEVAATVNEFWFEAIHVAQCIRRREFWVAKHRDWTMKTMLLQMLEWHARAVGGAGVNTWILGKRIQDWAEPESRAAIEQIWTGWGAAESWPGFFVQLDLFRRLTNELTRELGYDCAGATHGKIEAYIRNLYQEDEATRPKD